MPGSAVGADGAPICDEFACRTWGCWCLRAPVPDCVHGVPFPTCGPCQADSDRLDAIALQVAITGILPPATPSTSVPAQICRSRPHAPGPPPA